jgi:hypothetical protein
MRSAVPGYRPWAALLCAAVLPAMAADPAAPPRDQVDTAVASALSYLRKTQEANGSWRISRQGFGARFADGKSVGITGLAVMAFLSAGQTPIEGEHARAVADGVRWVLSRQRPNGVITSDAEFEMYHHGIATLMLAEVVGMCPPDLADGVRAALPRAVNVILTAQRPTGAAAGGWRYGIVGTDADLSVTGWQLLALRAAKNVGCDVPASAIDKAVAYVRRCYEENRGTFAYSVLGPVTVPCAGTGILGLELCGRDLHRCRESLRAASYILNHPPAFNQGHAFYGFYYCSQAMFQLGDPYWPAYRTKLHDLLLRSQRRDGSWNGDDNESLGLGPNYTTAMAVLALTVEYRLLPIYQRGDEPGEPGKDK